MQELKLLPTGSENNAVSNAVRRRQHPRKIRSPGEEWQDPQSFFGRVAGHMTRYGLVKDTLSIAGGILGLGNVIRDGWDAVESLKV